MVGLSGTKIKGGANTMASELKVEVTKKETIRPSSPTPHHLRTTTFSVFDQLSPDVYVPLLFFYPNDITSCSDVDNIDHCSSVAARSKLLKTSLSEALTHFYPFAGEFQYNISICCNDHGAAFLEAQVNCPMSKILDMPDVGMLKQLLPTGIGSSHGETDYLLLVQANFFECGGLAIGVSCSHIVADAYTLSTFLQTWAAVALGSNSTATDDDRLVRPFKFGAAASLFPQLDILNSPQPASDFSDVKCITKRFVFDASKIAALKSRAASATVPKPTRVEAVSALIWKCAMEASRSNSGGVRPSEWSLLVNMRKILVQQPSAENFMGNLVGCLAVKTEASEVVDIDVQSLVAKLRKEVGEFKAKYGNGVGGEEACGFFKEFGSLMKRGVDNYTCTSWCRLAFYDTNFGWGKPIWVCQSTAMKNLIVLMDTRDGNGIEASVTFYEEDMAIFESNKELLAYASVIPPIVIT